MVMFESEEMLRGEIAEMVEIASLWLIELELGNHCCDD